MIRANICNSRVSPLVNLSIRDPPEWHSRESRRLRLPCSLPPSPAGTAAYLPQPPAHAMAAAAAKPWAAAIAAATGVPFPTPDAGGAADGAGGVGVIWRVLESWVAEPGSGASGPDSGAGGGIEETGKDSDSTGSQPGKDTAGVKASGSEIRRGGSGGGGGGGGGGGEKRGGGGDGRSLSSVSQSQPAVQDKEGRDGSWADAWGDVVPSEPDGRAGYLPLPRLQPRLVGPVPLWDSWAASGSTRTSHSCVDDCWEARCASCDAAT